MRPVHREQIPSVVNYSYLYNTYTTFDYFQKCANLNIDGPTISAPRGIRLTSPQEPAAFAGSCVLLPTTKDTIPKYPYSATCPGSAWPIPKRQIVSSCRGEGSFQVFDLVAQFLDNRVCMNGIALKRGRIATK